MHIIEAFPLVISWLEQKAVVIFLTLFHLGYPVRIPHLKRQNMINLLNYNAISFTGKSWATKIIYTGISNNFDSNRITYDRVTGAS